MKPVVPRAAGATRLVLLAICCLTVPLTASSVSASTGPVQSMKLVSRRAIAPGVYVTHLRVRVSGVPDVQDVFRVSWLLGDSHIGLHTGLMGTRHTDGSVDTRPISQWAALAHHRGLKAAINGDYFTATSSTTAIPSGMIVRNGQLLQNGWGGHGGVPSVGFAPGGRLAFGRPTAVPVKFWLPGGHTATIARFAAPPTTSDQVGAYTHAGTSVRIPAGYTAVVLDTHINPLRGHTTYTNPTGSNVRETVSAFILTPIRTAASTTPVPIDPVARGTAGITVPRGGTVLLMKSRGLAATGFSTRLAQPTPKVTMATSAPAWAGVANVISGKPQVVTNGAPLLTKPAYVTNDQWYPQQFRPAIASTTDGHGWFIMIGSVNGLNGTSLTGVQFAQVLTQLGAKNALQLDNRHSTELYLPTPTNGMCTTSTGTCHTLMPHYERSIPEAAYLTYH